MNKWEQTEPGTLALTGTSMRIVYQPHRSGGGFIFAIYQGERFRQSWATLAMAKKEAERYHAELVEIGAEG